MNVTCSATPCPILLDSACVFYEGANLVYTGINTNDSVQTALQKIDAAIGSGIGGTGTSGTSGATGSSGTSGSSGSSGANGTRGTSGSSGSSGLSGSSGSSGSSGASGTRGTSGSSGSSGSSGTRGTSGTSGANGTAGSSGLAGDRYATTSSTSFTLGNAGTITVGTGLAYTVAQSILIAFDINNYQNSEVISYNSGTGVLTFAAPTNVVGIGTYSSWNVNLAGASGGDGSSGSSGTAGANGSSGTAGTSGANGSSGTAGADGATGTSGTSGSSNGTSGTSGATGSSGTAGADGATGTSGTSGSSNGTAGTAGTSGTTGPQGTSGTTGPQGTSGTTGPQGATGTGGTSGSSLASGTTQVYKVVIATSGGIMSSITSATAPDGTNILNTGGWTQAINIGTSLLSVTFPPGLKLIGAFAQGIDTSNTGYMRALSAVPGTSPAMNFTSATSIDFSTLTQAQLKYSAAGAGSAVVYILSYI